MRPPTGLATVRAFNQRRLSREVDRSSWPAVRSEVFTETTSGSGQAWSQALVFKTAFEGEPRFSFGVAAVGDLTVPTYAQAGVAGWQTHSSGDGRTIFYTGAWVWVAVDSPSSKELTWTFTFKGLALKNRENVPEAAPDAPPPIPQPPPPAPEPPPPPPSTLYRRYHSSDLVVLLRQYAWFQTDVVLLGVSQVPHTSDLVLAGREILTHTTDLWVESQLLLQHTTNMILLGSNQVTHTSDVILLDQVTLSHTGDLILVGVESLAHTTDLISRATVSLSHTTDLYLEIATLQVTHTTDLVAKGVGSAVHTTDLVVGVDYVRVSAAYLETLTQEPAPDVRVSAAYLETLTQEPVPDVRVSGVWVEVLVSVTASVTQHTTDLVVSGTTSILHTTDVVVLD